jgi:Flp pilus assembly protein TadD
MAKRPSLRILGLWLILALSTAVAYWPVLHFGFINYDDPPYVTANPHVLAGLTWKSIVWAFTSAHSATWHPLTGLSHMLDIQLFGLNPQEEHAVNLIFHISNTILLFLFLERITKRIWPSAVVAALFALHPLHVESVAWISERKDVLSTFFGLLCLRAYTGYVSRAGGGVKEKSETRNPKSETNSKPEVETAKHAEYTEKRILADVFRTRSPRFFYVLALVFFALGLMSKPMLVTLPFVMLLLDFWPLRRVELATGNLQSASPSVQHSVTPPLRLVIEKLPFFALTLILSLITFYVQRKSGAMMPSQGAPFGSRLANALVSYVRYLGKTIWPAKLALPYPLEPSWPIYDVAGAFLILLAISVVVLLAARTRPYLAVGWFWFVGMLVPVIGLVQVGMQSMADRYTYLPSVGLFIMVVWTLAESSLNMAKLKFALGMASVLVIGAYAFAARAQVNYWRDSITLFTHAIELYPNADEARGNLALALSNADRLEEAVAHFNIVLQSQPDDAEMNFDIAVALNGLGKTKEAIQHYRHGLLATPNSPDALNNLAWILATNPDPQLRNGKEAVELAEKACRLTDYKRPMFVGTLAAAYAEAGRFSDAVASAEKAIALAESANQSELVTKNRELLQLYRVGKPYRETGG